MGKPFLCRLWWRRPLSLRINNTQTHGSKQNTANEPSGRQRTQATQSIHTEFGNGVARVGLKTTKHENESKANSAAQHNSGGGVRCHIARSRVCKSTHPNEECEGRLHKPKQTQVKGGKQRKRNKQRPYTRGRGTDQQQWQGLTSAQRTAAE